VYPVQKFTSGQVSNALGPSVVSFVRTHPDVKYVSVTYDPAASFIVPALASAGFGKKVHVVSQLGDAQNLDFIRKGNVQDGDGAWDNEYEGWATVDQIIRLVTRKPLWVSKGPARYKYGENIPYVLLTKSNVPKAGTDWHASVDYISKYKKLWGLK
jgi:ribose transport system substrate-binding protein